MNDISSAAPAKRRRIALLLGSALALALAGCTMGPDFLRPKPPQTDSFTPEPTPAQITGANTAGGATQTLVAGEDIPGQWWELFHSRPLNDLIEQALKASPTLQAAQATLREAQENVLADKAAFAPTVTANEGISRDKTSKATAGFSSVYNLYNASVAVSYVPDVFGGNKRRVESAQAQAEYEQFQIEAAYLTLTANLVTAAVTEASIRAQIDATQRIIQLETQQLTVTQNQFKLGAISRADVLAQQSALAQTKATLPGLQSQLAHTVILLGALAGKLPSEASSVSFDLASLQLPTDLPLGVPSKLVDQRPDVRASEALLHEASAEIGVTQAAALPQITLSADYGFQALTFDTILKPASTVWSFGQSLMQTLFDGGKDEHAKKAADDAFDAAQAQYHATVIAAFQDVANSLRSLQSDADALKAELEAQQSAAASLALSRSQYQAGAITFLSVLTAEQASQTAEINLVKAQAARYADTAALFQALGGGWWNRNDVAAPVAAANQNP